MKRIQGFKIEYSEVLVTAKWSDFREGAAIVPSSVVKSRLLLQLVASQKDGLVEWDMLMMITIIIIIFKTHSGSIECHSLIAAISRILFRFTTVR